MGPSSPRKHGFNGKWAKFLMDDMWLLKANRLKFPLKTCFFSFLRETCQIHLGTIFAKGTYAHLLKRTMLNKYSSSNHISLRNLGPFALRNHALGSYSSSNYVSPRELEPICFREITSRLLLRKLQVPFSQESCPWTIFFSHPFVKENEKLKKRTENSGLLG
jgi:hypothetical protein